MRLEFADCVLDTEARQICRAGVEVRLSSKAYELLHMLADARPRALSKDELYTHLWPDTYVIEANLANLIAEIRAVLGDDAHKPHIIRTVHRFGYAFCGNVATVAPPRDVPCCLVWNERRLPLVTGKNLIGREPEARILLDLPSVSRRHAIITVGTGEIVIEDLGSKNGTTINGRPVVEATRLDDGDHIRIGSVELSFRVWAPDKSTETVSER